MKCCIVAPNGEWMNKLQFKSLRKTLLYLRPLEEATRCVILIFGRIVQHHGLVEDCIYVIEAFSRTLLRRKLFK